MGIQGHRVNAIIAFQFGPVNQEIITAKLFANYGTIY
jgi:hypothetical protein